MKQKKSSESAGMALLLTLLILAMLSLMATSFVSNMSLDGKIVSNLSKEVSAGFIAEAGLNHAINVLCEDGDFITPDPNFEKYDWNTGSTANINDDWVTLFIGDEVDVADTVSRANGQVASGTPDSRWIYLHKNPIDSNSYLIGRYAVLIEDENSKININTVGSDYDAVEANQEGLSVSEIDLKDLFENIGAINNSAADNIDGYAQKPFSDVSELQKISNIGDSEFLAVEPYLTSNSYDHDLYYDAVDGFVPKVNINYETRLNVFSDEIFDELSWADNIKEVLAAINLLDYRDCDTVPTVYSETDLSMDINGDGATNATTYVYGTEGIQVNEVFAGDWILLYSTNGSFVTKEAGTFAPSGNYHWGLSPDGTSIAYSRFQIPWDNGTYTVRIKTTSDAGLGDMNCKVEGVGYSVVPASGSRNYNVTISDGNLTIEVEDIVDAIPPQKQCRFESVEIFAGDFIEVVNISSEDITITTQWMFVFDNATPASSADDRIYHVGADVTLSGATSSAGEPSTATYNYLVLTNTKVGLDIIHGTVVNGVWDGPSQIAVLLDSSNNPTFNILDSGNESVTVKDATGVVIDNISASSPNNYCTTGYKPGGGLTAKVSREKISPDYDLTIGGIGVWSNSSTAGNLSFFGTPGEDNSSASSYVVVRDSYTPNLRFFYDMPKNENHNNRAGALTSAINYSKAIGDKCGFVNFKQLGSACSRRTNWVNSGTHLSLNATVFSGSKISWKWSKDPSDLTIPPDGEYRIFVSGIESGEVHNINGTYFNGGSGSVENKDVLVSFSPFHGEYWGCIQGVFASGEDDLFPFEITQGLFTLSDNSHASTAPAQNTIKEIVLQPAGFTPLLAGRLNINTAGAYILQTLPGVNNALAQAIVDHSITTPFTEVSDLLDVSGMTFAQYCKIASLVTVRSSSFRIIVLAQSIKDVNKNGSFDSGDIILAEKKSYTSVCRGIEKDADNEPDKIKVYRKYFYWGE